MQRDGFGRQVFAADEFPAHLPRVSRQIRRCQLTAGGIPEHKSRFDVGLLGDVISGPEYYKAPDPPFAYDADA
jgi:hypothetical protein